MLLKLSFWQGIKENAQGEICLERLDKDMYDEMKSRGIIKQIITLLKSSQYIDNEKDSLKKYSTLVVKGRFYEYIQEQFQPIYPDRFDSRQKVKREVLRILYLNPDEAGDAFHRPCQTFNRLFPDEYRLFELVKSINHTYLPIILQRLESFLVLDVVCKEISCLHPHIPLFTIHDNIITTKGNEVIVKEIMQQQIEKWTGYRPKVDSKDLVPIYVDVQRKERS
jgi:hypothetical protein